MSAPRPLPGLHASLAAITSRDEAWWRKHYPWPARYDPTETRIVFHGNDEPDHVRRDVDVAAFRDGKRVGIFANAVRTHDTPEEAQESLITAGLLPGGWSERSAWWCRQCGGQKVALSGDPRTSLAALVTAMSGIATSYINLYGPCRCVSRMPVDVRLADVVAVAALGVPLILRAEEIIHVTCPSADVVWCVAPPKPPDMPRFAWLEARHQTLPADALTALRDCGVHDGRAVRPMADKGESQVVYLCVEPL